MLKEIMPKKVDELTVGDHLKLNGLVIAVMVGGLATLTGASVAVEEIRGLKAKRKLKKEETSKKEET